MHSVVLRKQFRMSRYSLALESIPVDYLHVPQVITCAWWFKRRHSI